MYGQGSRGLLLELDRAVWGARLLQHVAPGDQLHDFLPVEGAAEPPRLIAKVLLDQTND